MKESKAYKKLIKKSDKIIKNLWAEMPLLQKQGFSKPCPKPDKRGW